MLVDVHGDFAVEVAWPSPQTLCRPVLRDKPSREEQQKHQLQRTVSSVQHYPQEEAQSPSQLKTATTDSGDEIQARDRQTATERMGLLKELADIRESMRNNREKAFQTLRAIDKREKEKLQGCVSST